MNRNIKKITTIVFVAIFLVQCSTVPITGRKRLDLVSDSEALPASFSQYKGFLEKNIQKKQTVNTHSENFHYLLEKGITTLDEVKKVLDI